MTLFDSLEHHADNIAVIDDQGTEHSFSALLKDAEAIGNLAGAGNLVLFAATNSYASIAGYVGLIRSGAVPLMVHHSIKPEEFSALTEIYQPSYIFAPSEMGVETSETVQSLGDYTLSKTGLTADNPPHPGLALLLTTSGSTGNKSLVRLSQKNLASNCEQICECLAIKSSDRAITTMPMNYTYGLSVIHSHLQAGASIVATEAPLMVPAFWQLLKDSKATSFSGVPFIYEMLKKLRFARMDLPYLKHMTQAGGKLSEDLTQHFAELCAEKTMRFTIMYGQTEATARMAYVPAERLSDKIGSAGIAIPGGKIWLEDESGARIIETDQSGELIYSGENVSMGYATCRKDLSKGDQNCGILRTGDIATRDADGFFYIVGRKKRFLKLYGNRVNLDEVDAMLKSAGFDTACVGRDDNMKVCTTEAAKTEAIRAFLKAETVIPPRGFKVSVVESIPRGEAGKINYHLLNQQFEAQ